MRVRTCLRRHVPQGQLTAPPWSPGLVRNSLQIYKWSLLTFIIAIFIPTILLEPVFQPAKFGSWVRNRDDAISRSKEYRQNDIGFLWNTIQKI
jgi:hypothetical protein